jgi:hypothetical protein
MSDLMSNPLGAATAGAEDPRPAVSPNKPLVEEIKPRFPYKDLREWIWVRCAA